MNTSKLYSYVVDHDHGFAPNPSGMYCTLVHCKFAKSGGKRNLVEMANVGDWVLGTGGQSSDSAGNGRIIYLMRVDEKLDFGRYLRDTRFAGRLDHSDEGQGNKFALVSRHFFYFGREAVGLSELPSSLHNAGLEKRGPSYRSDLPGHLVHELVSWFERTFEPGRHGEPCSPLSSADVEAIHQWSIPGAGSHCMPSQPSREGECIRRRKAAICRKACD
ncbi:hypothetical protein [Massilia alkalitolerans]|uniref:Nmad2 family putative nucleotide modification protein n=1 Tax=Massilia alkalitolerans TaxID=286638 RepID=UPI00351D78BB